MTRAKKTLASLLVTLCLLLVPPAMASTGQYVAGSAATIWCAADDHDVAPSGVPGTDDPVGWLLSGQPECAAADLDNDLRELNGDPRIEHGYGGFAFDAAGGLAAILLDDEAGSTAAMIVHDQQSGGSEVCGPYVGPVANGLNWVSIPVVLVDADLDACVATTGTWSVTAL